MKKLYNILFIALVFLQFGISQTVSSLVSAINSDLYSSSRTSLRVMTNTAAVGNATERNAHEADLVAELGKAHNWQAKSMVLLELQLMATQESTLDEVAKLLTDANLVEPAAGVIIHVGRYAHDEEDLVLYDKARSVVRTALNGASGDFRGALLKAAGSLRDYLAVDIFLSDATSSDPEIKRMALRGLANTGDPRAKDVLLASVNTTNEYDLGMFLDFTLLYALRLAQRGDAAAANEVAQAIEDLPGDCAHYITAATETKSEIPGIGTDFGLPVLGTSIEFRYGLNDKIFVERDGKMALSAIPSAPYTLELMDLKGKLVWNKNLKANEKVEVNTLPKGVFWVKLSVEKEKEISQKIRLY